MKVILSAVLMVILVSCSEKKENVIESELIATNLRSKGKARILKNKIIGGWRQLKENCDGQGRNCDRLTEEISWTFKENDVVWGRFTHPYYISNDTAYIAGIAHRIILISPDTLLFHLVDANDYFQLIRK